MQQCLDCGSGYLDPRPTPDTLGLAYASYYTHNDPELETASKRHSRFGRIARGSVNGYRNRQYAANVPDASRVGGFAISLLPPIAAYFDASARHLPKPLEGRNRLLDVGCGNGKFMRFATQAGWECTGLDLDSKAVNVCREAGLDAFQGTLEAMCSLSEEFDLITASHLIEHVYEPATLIEDCYRLLKPGGRLWIETPNVDSVGHGRFGSHWRGLEPPRHLTLLTRGALTGLLSKAGFESISYHNRGLTALFTYAESRLIASDERAGADSVRPTLSPRYWSDIVRQYYSSDQQEFLTVSADRGPA